MPRSSEAKARSAFLLSSSSSSLLLLGALKMDYSLVRPRGQLWKEEEEEEEEEELSAQPLGTAQRTGGGREKSAGRRARKERTG
mmetsp:Transcript_39196/g.79171  ORF Transcript_39196/g.79171 Transcript_39196/m.79171 type:complete len:84 (+) Transcript_39196:2853-3104(+)